MSLRGLLAGLVVVATAAFVVGTLAERNASGESGHHDESSTAAPATGDVGHPEAGGETSEAGAERATEHAAQSAGTATETSPQPSHAELRPLGIDIEAWPFVTLAAILSLSLAAVAWLRPQATLVVGVVAAFMLAFAALDVREAIHQVDVDESALALVSAAIALLHAGAAGLAVALMWRARPTMA